MEEKDYDSIALFDTLFTTNHLQIMKKLLPYLDAPMQKHMAFYIKYEELKYTMSYYSGRQAQISGCSAFNKKEFNLQEFYQDVRGYCTVKERSRLEQMVSMMNQLGQMKEMMGMMEMMKQMSSDSDGADPMEMAMGMLSPDQRMMFEMFKNMEE